MKTKIVFLNLLLITCSTVHADQAATLTCSGENVVLVERSPYMGEDSKSTQSLFVLKSKNSNDHESRDTAYFLKIYKEGASSRTIYTGRNEVGGFFQLDVSAFEDIGDGTIIRESSTGYLDYSQGPLQGHRENVKCLRE